MWKYGHKIFWRKCGKFYIRVMKIWMQILWQEIKKYISMSHIPTWSHETWNFFTFVIWKHLWSLSFMKYWILSNIWKTCVNFPTRNIEFSHRFHAWALIFSIFPLRKFELKSSYVRFEILTPSHLTIWGEIFSYGIWIHMKYEFSICEIVCRFIHMKENFPWFRNYDLG